MRFQQMINTLKKENRIMKLNRKEYRNKVLGCWMGKNIGGTLGAPFEWQRQINNVSFYTQKLKGEPLPNDDLDIQLLWLIALEEQGIEIDSHILSEYWCLYVTPHWCEYGTAKANMRAGLLPPLSGILNNEYKHSCGSFIRSEIWACIAPGCPQITVKYAYEDSILDHGDGEGTYAEIFCAALESAAFVISDIRKLIEIALSYIPKHCGVRKAIECVIDAYDSGRHWKQAREAVLKGFRGSSAMGDPANTSEADQKNGFHKGKQGYDAPSNVAMIVLGLLYGEGDFDKTICTTVNCGEDTDCTGATVGSIFGILHGVQAIPRKWIDPIGNSIKTACLNLGELGYFGDQLPQTVDELTDRTGHVACQVLMRNPMCGIMITNDEPTDLSSLSKKALVATKTDTLFYSNMDSLKFRFPFFLVEVDYGSNPVIRNGEPKKISFTIHNTYKVQANVFLHWYLPNKWEVSPTKDGFFMSLPVKPNRLGKETTLEFMLQTECVDGAINRCVLQLTIEGRPTIMLIPITLMNGNVIEKTKKMKTLTQNV